MEDAEGKSKTGTGPRDNFNAFNPAPQMGTYANEAMPSINTPPYQSKQKFAVPLHSTKKAQPTQDNSQATKLEAYPANPNGEDHLVNSSLMFFSTRPDVSSLHLLANSPKLEPQALEILLRNWKPGGEYMIYLNHFIQKSTCCTAILVVNWTRWWGTDETLFDLVNQVVPEDQRVMVTKTLLRGDQKYHREFTRLRASWADAWRLACQQGRWRDAKDHLMALEFNAFLKNCALSVIAETLLEKLQRNIESWRIGNSSNFSNQHQPFPVIDRDEYLVILKDCREMRLDIIGSWYEYGEMPWLR